MKVFLSWSGELSHQVALVFKEYLPEIIQSLEPFVSSEDIEKGARWGTEMAQELEQSRYGIICVTKENVSKPWLNFEAGALSRSIEKATVVPFSTAVSPFLFDLKSSDLEGPLTQFQYVKNERSELLKLILSVNGKVEVNQLSTDKIERAFKKWWPDLERDLAKVASAAAGKASAAAPRKPDEILDELLELVRAQQRWMVSKDDLISLFTSGRYDPSQLSRGGINYSFPNLLSASLPLRTLIPDLPNVVAGTTVVGPTAAETNAAVGTTVSARPQDASSKKPK